MRTTLSVLAVAATLGAATPALADVGSLDSMQRAIMVANEVGIVGVQEVQYTDGQWQIEGRDPRGQNLTVDVDPITDAVISVDRF